MSILNRSRQRRDHSALSFTWYERAAFAETLGTDPRFTVLAKFCHAQRLDCLLDAALAAWDAELVIAGEEPQAWWWVEQVTSARLALGMHNTWRTAWIRVWHSVAVAMQAVSLDQVLIFCPADSSCWTLLPLVGARR